MFENPRSCFPVDPDGNEVVTFDEENVDYHSVLIVHRISTIIVCLIGLALNFLLLAIIIRNPNNLCNLRKVVMFGCFLETALCLSWLICVPFNYAGYGRAINFVNNGLHIQSLLVNTLVLVLTIALTLGSWSYSSFLFVYRLHLIKHGSRPTSTRLFLYSLIPLVTTVFYVYCVVTTWKFDNEGIENSMNVLRHFGYSVEPAEIRESKLKDLKTKLHFALFGVGMLVNNGLIVYCSVSMRRILRAGPVTSAATKRLHGQMDRVLLMNVLLPFICNIIPTSFITKKISGCEYHPWSDVFCLFIVNLALVLSPTFTIFFIKPYKRTAQRWFGCGEGRRTSLVETSLTFNNMNYQSPNIFHQPNHIRASIATIGLAPALPLRAKPFACSRMMFEKSRK